MIQTKIYICRVQDWRTGKRYEAEVEITIDWNEIATDVGNTAVLNKTRKSTALARAVRAKVIGERKEIE